MLRNNDDTMNFFEAKLTLFNKNKSGTMPTTNQLRLIACTCICQKIIEFHLLRYAKKYMVKYIHQSQLGFI